MSALAQAPTKHLPEWQKDKRWSDQFIPEIKRICGECLIGEAPEYEDQHHNTDLIVLHMSAMRIACRVRRHQCYKPYGLEFTIRSSRAGGNQTELAKIMDGWGNYFFYAFAAQDQPELYAWKLADLDVFREWYTDNLKKELHPGQHCVNADRRSAFLSFPWKAMPETFVIAAGCQMAA